MERLFILIFILALSLYAQDNKKITLQLSWLHQFQFAGFYVAKEKGYYKNVGLDVEIKEFDNKNLTKELEKNKIDFGIGRSSLLIEKINGQDIVAIAAIFQHSPMMLLTLEESNINRVKDLRNKKVMITPDAKNMASILAMLTSNKLKDSEFDVLPHSFNLDDLITKKTDAMASYLSNEPIILNEKGIKYKVFNPKNYGFDFYNDILFTSSKFIKNNPKSTQDFYNATIKGWKYAFNNIVEVSELIQKKYNSQNKSLIHLIKEGEILKNLAFNEDGDIGCLEKSRLKDILNVFKVLGLINNGDSSLDEFIYEGNNHKKITFELNYYQKDILIISITFLVLLFIIIIYFLRKAKFDNHLLDSVINGTDDLIYYKDKNFKYIGCNKAFEKFVGKSKNEIIGKTINDLFDENISLTLSNVDKNVLLGNSSEIINEWITSSDGKEVYMQTKKTPFKYSLKDIGVLGISRDLSKLKILEDEQLKQQKTLLTQSKIAAMGEMLGNIAHQWRQPLSVITTNISSLKLSIDLGDELTNEHIVECSDVVIRQSKYLSKTIDDFKNFFSSNVEDIHEFNIKNSIFSMDRLIKDSFKNEGIEYVTRLEDCLIIQNENILIQAFMNICNNAKDAILINKIDDNKKYFFIFIEKSENSVEIIFRDSGGGIKNDIIDKLFEPYFTTKHQALGTGIGLYMSHQIIIKHFNGTIKVRNIDYTYDGKNLRGAEFIVNLPLN